MKKLYLCFVFALCGCLVANATSFPDGDYDDLLVLELQDSKSDLSPLYAFVDKYADVIKEKKVPVYISGYSNTLPVSKTNSQNAAECAKMVKEALLNKGLPENQIFTESFSGSYDEAYPSVIVRIGIPKGFGKAGSRYVPRASKPQEEAPTLVYSEIKFDEVTEDEPVFIVGRRQRQAREERVRPVREQQVRETRVRPVREPKVREFPEPKVHEPKVRETRVRREIPQPESWSEFNIRTNIVFLGALTPNLGFEYRFGENSSIMINGGWAHWNWDNDYRTYRVWFVTPEYRYYLGKNNRGYLGLQAQYGELNYMFDETGRQGEFYGGSITGGYILPLSYKLSLDFNLGLGYTHYKYDKYQWMNMPPVNKDVRVTTDKDCKFNLWGPNHVGISLIWHISR